MTLTDDAKAVVALTTRLGSRQRPSLTPKMWYELSQALTDAGHSPHDIFDRTFDVSTVPGVGANLSDRIGQLTADAAGSLLEIDELRHKGIWATTILDDGYPPILLERLGRKAPPVLFGSGNINSLTQPGIGIVGSREVNEIGGDIAKLLARTAASLGRSVVSGRARGVDQLAMSSAFASGGTVIGVLADSLIGRIRKPDVLEALDEGKVCLLTAQAPSSGFTPAAAMSRNKIIYGLAEVTVVVASEENSGGTWAGATEAISDRNGIVAVWRGDGEGPGNEALERLGARSISDPGELVGFLDTEARADQMSLDFAP